MLDTTYHDDDAAKCDPLAALAELEQNTSAAIWSKRAHDRVALRMTVVAEPGNASQRHKSKVQGVSNDVSAGGCSVLFPSPIYVGDIYLLTFDRSVIDVPPTLARCLRCQMVREDAFQCGFRFFTPLEIPNLESRMISDLLS